MNKNLTIAALLGAFTIILGAFGAHALQETLNVQELKSFETGVRYQMYHVVVLLFVNTYQGFSSKIKNTTSYFFFFGILLFSGSIYAISLGVEARSIWFITPLGGFLLILGWLFMVFSLVRNRK